MITTLLMFLMSGGPAAPVSRELLLEPFAGFTTEGMAPLYALFRADSEGRLLLRQARRKLGPRIELDEIFCPCSLAELSAHSERRGLFAQETARLFRLKGETTWREESRGALDRLADEARFPLVAREQSQDANFEYLRVAFRPKICVKPGLSNLQTYLVLFHELTHLIGLDPFADLDLSDFDPEDRRERFYYKQLARPGGEMDAFLAQILALGRIKQRYALDAVSPLEDFLNDRGRLTPGNRPAFLEHLLTEANYQAELDAFLDEQVYLQYNRALAWWTLYERVLAQMAERMLQIEKNIAVARAAIDEAGARNDRAMAKHYSQALVRWQREKQADEAKAGSFRAARQKHADLMSFLDVRFPR